MFVLHHARGVRFRPNRLSMLRLYSRRRRMIVSIDIFSWLRIPLALGAAPSVRLRSLSLLGVGFSVRLRLLTSPVLLKALPGTVRVGVWPEPSVRMRCLSCPGVTGVRARVLIPVSFGWVVVLLPSVRLRLLIPPAISSSYPRQGL